MNSDEFLELVTAELGKPNPEQAKCLKSGTDIPTFIVAGPGSGKTRVLVQRALRHVCVDQILPEKIVITTFTKKAAKEIRSRLIEWGEKIIKAAKSMAESTSDYNMISFLESVDLNRFVTGTLDSLCEEALEISRTPAEPRYMLLDPFSARTLMSRKGKLSDARNASSELDTFLGRLSLNGRPPQTNADAVSALKPIADRVIHDLVDDAVFDDKSNTGRYAALQVIKRYDEYLEENAQLDFPRLERVVLQRLKAGRDVGAISDAKAILVDEYQDTNLLQEQIYYELVRRNSAALTVVGDDDQSLYRFRGATIELFRDFVKRAQDKLSCAQISPVYLKRNYRSTEDIVRFFNDFIKNDPSFSPSARVQPLKPETTVSGERENFPILGIFRESPEECAKAVADFLVDVFSNGGAKIRNTGQILRGNLEGGAYGDAVLLSKSVREFGSAVFGKDPKPKFPHFLRQRLEERGVQVFNPRGRPSHDVCAVRKLLGLILMSFDPHGTLQAGLSITSEAKRMFSGWRMAAGELLEENPKALDSKLLTKKLDEMQLQASVNASSRDTPVLDFVYAFTPYMEIFADDPEYQVYMESITRAAAQMISFSGYRGSILRDSQHNKRSLESALRDFLAPLAEDDIEIDEEIFADVPRTFFNMMTIHQAKGLEFPMVLVDVSSECVKDHHMQRFKRFPEEPSATVKSEEEFAPFTSIGSLRKQRTPLQRSFEDITREYYVAYSRPECVLVLIGCSKTLSSKTNTKHIGQFWRTDKSWAWTEGYPKKKPPALAHTPFLKL